VRRTDALPRSAHSLVTVFDRLPGAGDPARLVAEAARATLRGGSVVLASWGPPERCDSAAVLEVAQRRGHAVTPFALSRAGVLEELAVRAGLRPAGGGLVSCPFAYPELESAVRGMLSTGLYRSAVADSGAVLVAKELEEALHPYVRSDGTVRMANVFRYVVAEKA
jgi:hypothetical protein